MTKAAKKKPAKKRSTKPVDGGTALKILALGATGYILTACQLKRS